MKVLALSSGGMVEINLPVLGGAGITTLDFGTGKSDTSINITGQTSILSNSVIQANITGISTASHSVDEHYVEEIEVYPGNIIPGTGFTIFARTKNIALRGQYSVSWVWV